MNSLQSYCFKYTLIEMDQSNKSRKTVTKKPDEVLKVKAGKSSQDALIKGILENDTRTIQKIYREQFDSIKSMVYNFKGLQLEPEDIFQEGLTRAILNIRKGLFKRESTFSTYLFGICRNLCLKEYRRNKPVSAIELVDSAEDPEEDHFDTLKIINEVKDHLDENCRKIIDLRFGIHNSQDEEIENTRFESVATALDITPANARQRYKRCFAKFIDMLQKHPEFNLLTDRSWK